jgi:hypothetical protein
MSEHVSLIPGQLDDPEPGSTWFFSLAGIVILVALVVAASVMYFRAETGEVDTKVIDQGYERLDALRSSWREQLASYQRYPWVQADGQTVQKIRIPSGRAMELLVQEGLPKAASSVSATASPAGGQKP